MYKKNYTALFNLTITLIVLQNFSSLYKLYVNALKIMKLKNILKYNKVNKKIAFVLN